MRKIVFVCLGNIIRSPTAETVLKKKVLEEGRSDHYLIESRGLLRSQVGSERDHRMVKTSKQRGYELTGRSTLVTLQDLLFFDEIYAADRSVLERLLSLAPGEAERLKISLFTSHSKDHPHHDVPDPYYEGGEAGFQHVLDMIEEACCGILAIKKI